MNQAKLKSLSLAVHAVTIDNLPYFTMPTEVVLDLIGMLENRNTYLRDILYSENARG